MTERSLECEYRSLEVPLPSAATQSSGHHTVGSSGGSEVTYDDPVKRRNPSDASPPPSAGSRAGYRPDVPTYTSAVPQQARRDDGKASTTAS